MKIRLLLAAFGAAALALTACAGSSTQVVTVTAPAPDDSAQEEPENGADPGASEPAPFTFGDFGVVSSELGGEYSVTGVVFIENPNADQYLDSGMYRITARDAGGAVIGNTEDFVESVPPLGTAPLYFSLTTTARDAEFTFEYLEADWIESAGPAEAYLPFQATGVGVNEDFENSYLVTGEIVNPYDIRLDKLYLTAVALDDDGKPIGVGIDYPSGVAALGLVPFAINMSTTEAPANVTVYAQPFLSDNPWKDTAEGNPPPS